MIKDFSFNVHFLIFLSIFFFEDFFQFFLSVFFKGFFFSNRFSRRGFFSIGLFFVSKKISFSRSFCLSKVFFPNGFVFVMFSKFVFAILQEVLFFCAKSFFVFFLCKEFFLCFLQEVCFFQGFVFFRVGLYVSFR